MRDVKTFSRRLRHAGSYLKRAGRNVAAKPQVFFLSFFLPAAIILAFVLPPFMGPDEASHTYRVYEFSTGDIILNKDAKGYGAPIPDTLIQLNSDQFWENAKKTPQAARDYNQHIGTINAPHKTMQYFENTSVYSPLGYVHFIIGMWISRFLNLPVYTTFMFLRLINIAAFAIIVYYAIKLMPKRKWLLTAIALLPMMVHQATVISPDGVINAAGLLTVAIIAYIIDRKRVNSYKLLALLGTAIFIVAFSKQAYVFFPLVLLVLPKEAFRQLRLTKLKYFLVVVAVVVAALGVWTLGTSKVTADAFNVWRARDNFGPTATTGNFVKDLVLQPVTTGQVLAKSFVYDLQYQGPLPHIPESLQTNVAANFTLVSLLGDFGSLLISYPLWVYFFVVAGIVVPLLAEKDVLLASVRDRRIIGSLMLLIFATLTFILWLKWTAVNSPIIIGMQGRYLLPIAGLLVFLPGRKYFKLELSSPKVLPTVIATCVSVGLIMMIGLVIAQFYVFPSITDIVWKIV